MPPRKEICRNFARGSCKYGDRCKFLHVSPQQSKPNPFGFGMQAGQQHQNTNFQQQNPNPFNVQNNFQSRAAHDFGSKQNQYKWSRPSNTDGAAKKQPDNQPSAPSHQCTDPDTCKRDPDTCKRQIMEDFQQEKPMWKLTCYGHIKSGPCDIAGDTSYEELRASAYDDAKRGLSLQSIVERERNLILSKVREFESLLNSHPFKGLPSTPSPHPFAAAVAQTPSVAAQRTDPPLFASFGQLGTSLSTGAPAAAPNSVFGQSNPFQNNNQKFQMNNLQNPNPGFGGQPQGTIQSPFTSSFAGFGNNSTSSVQNHVSNSGFGGQPQGTIESPSMSGFASFNNKSTSSVQNHVSNSGFGGQPQGTVQSPLTSGFASFGNNSTSSVQNHTSNSGFGGQPQGTIQSPLTSGFASFGNNSTSSVPNQVSASTFLSQIPGSSNGQSSIQNVPTAIGSSTLSKKTGSDDSIWLKQEWGIGEIPEEAPPDIYCS